MKRGKVRKGGGVKARDVKMWMRRKYDSPPKENDYDSDKEVDLKDRRAVKNAL